MYLYLLEIIKNFETVLKGSDNISASNLSSLRLGERRLDLLGELHQCFNAERRHGLLDPVSNRCVVGP